MDLEEEERENLDGEDGGVMNAVLAAERHAYLFYLKATEATDRPELRELFQELAELEKSHVKIVNELSLR